MQCRRPWFDSWVGKIPWRRDRLPAPVFLGFPVAHLVKDLSIMWRAGFDPWVEGRVPREGKGYPLQYSCLDACTVHGVAKSQTPLSDFHFHFSSDGKLWFNKRLQKTETEMYCSQIMWEEKAFLRDFMVKSSQSMGRGNSCTCDTCLQ